MNRYEGCLRLPSPMDFQRFGRSSSRGAAARGILPKKGMASPGREESDIEWAWKKLTTKRRERTLQKDGLDSPEAI
jgi:hypothetical protein